MARSRSPEKRAAILDAAMHEIARDGLGASTANIARRAGIAAGTLFTYFPNKELLLNELYLELKAEAYASVNTGFPHTASLERRARHIWVSYLGWSLASPSKRKVSMQLNVSDVVTAQTRALGAESRGLIDHTMRELDARSAARGMPAGFPAASMSALQEATTEFIAKQPKRSADFVEASFQFFWRAFR